MQARWKPGGFSAGAADRIPGACRSSPVAPVTAPLDALHLPLGPPAADPLESLVRDVLAVAADVVDAARKHKRRKEGAPCVCNPAGAVPWQHLYAETPPNGRPN